MNYIQPLIFFFSITLKILFTLKICSLLCIPLETWNLESSFKFFCKLGN